MKFNHIIIFTILAMFALLTLLYHVVLRGADQGVAPVVEYQP